MLAQPTWGWPNVIRNANAVFLAGSRAVRDQVQVLCRERRLELLPEPSGWGIGEGRWNALRASAIGIFDLTMPSPVDRASVCHDLGSALVLGVSPVVVTRRSERAPFDIDLPPVELEAGNIQSLAEGLDSALFRIFPTSRKTSIEDTARQVLARTGADSSSRGLARHLAERRLLDPVEAEAALGLLVGRSTPSDLALIHPIWPAFYPNHEEPLCFHVMPFKQEWSGAAQACVRDACESENVRYGRGDDDHDVRIMHAIWEQICRATHLVIDLTGLTPNVCLELALAQGIGRPILLVARDQWTLDHLFPAISKLQVRIYDSYQALAELVRQFLKRHQPHEGV